MIETERKIIDTRVTVETPEGVDFQYVVAGPGKRGAAYAVDFLLRASIVAVASIFGFLLGISFSIPGGTTFALFLIAWFATTWLYGALFESFMRGQTPGKRMMNLRVTRTNGTPVGWFEAFGRNLLMGADGWVVLGVNPALGFRLNTVALISMGVTPKLQRLGDVLFDTMVVDETRELVRRADSALKLFLNRSTGSAGVPVDLRGAIQHTRLRRRFAPWIASHRTWASFISGFTPRSRCWRARCR